MKAKRTATASEDVAFVDRLLESWAAWSRNAGLPLISHCSARYSTGHDKLRCVLRLDDGKFARVDAVVAKLEKSKRAVIWLHYCRDENESKSRKAAIAGMTTRAYSAALHDAQLDVHDGLRPDVYDWQLSA